MFSPEMLTVQETYLSLTNIVESVLKMRPQIKIVFTVSPVRHTKEGIVENSLSKSTLIVACHQKSFAKFFGT